MATTCSVCRNLSADSGPSGACTYCGEALPKGRTKTPKAPKYSPTKDPEVTVEPLPDPPKPKRKPSRKRRTSEDDG